MKGIKFVLCVILLFFGCSGKVWGQSLQKEGYAGGNAAGFSRGSVNFGVTVTASPAVACEKDEVIFTASLQAADAGPYTYVWYKDGSVISRNASFTKPSVALPDAGEYYCEATNDRGITVASAVLSYVVKPRPFATITSHESSAIMVCYGDTLRLTGSSAVSGATFAWTGKEIVGATDQPTLRALPVNDGRYMLQTTLDGCVSEDTVYVRVNHTTVDIPFVTNVSEGAQIYVTATDASGNKISPATGLSWTVRPSGSGGAVNPFAITATAGMEMITVAYEYDGCVVKDSMVVNTKGNISFTGGGSDGFTRTSLNFGARLVNFPAVVCEDIDTALHVNVVCADDPADYRLEWYHLQGSSVAKVANGDRYGLAPVVLSDSGFYFCKVINKRGDIAYSDTLKMKVSERAIATIMEPANRRVTICYGDTLKLKGKSSVAGAAFKWMGTELIGDPNEVQLKAFPTVKREYILRTTNAGCWTEDTVSVEVNHPTVDLPFLLNVAEGAAVLVTATDAGGTKISPATGLTWTTNLTSVSGTDVNPFPLTVEEGLEKVYVSYNRDDCVVHDSMLLNMKGSGSFFGGDNDGFARTSVNFGVKLDYFPQVLCQGVDTALNASVVCVDDQDAYRMEWFKLNPQTSLGTTSRIPLSPLQLSDSGYYYCKVTNKAGISVYSDTMHLTVNEVALARIIRPSSRDTLICWGDTVQIMGSSSVAMAKLKWTGGSILTPDTAALISIAPLTETEYIFRADNEGCATEDTLTVKINRPFVDIPTIQNLTEGSSLQLTATDVSGTALEASGLEWRIRPSSVVGVNVNPLALPAVDQDIVVEVTLHSGSCTATDSTRVLVKGAGAFRGGRQDGFTRTCLPPVILVQPNAGSNQCVTASKSLELTVVAEGTGIVYRWEKWSDHESEFKPFTPSHDGVTGEKSPTLKFISMLDSDNGQYRCVLNGLCGEEVISDTCMVSVKGEPVILSGINVDRDICAGSGEFQFNVIARNSAGTGNLQYRWYKNSLSQQISQEADTLVNYYKLNIGPTGAEDGLYIVEVSNACGSVYDSAYLPVITPPMIQEQPTDVKACYGGEAEFWVKTNRDEKYRYALYELSSYPALNPKKKVAESYTNKFVVSGLTRGGYYQIKVFHPSCDSSFSNPIALHIEYPITLNGESADTTLCEDMPLQLRVDASTIGEEPLNYQWFKNGIALGNAANSGELNLSKVKYEQDTVYFYCIVSNSCGVKRSRNIAVAVKRSPMIGSGPELLPEYCEGDTLRAEVVLRSKAEEIDSIRWFYQGRRLWDVPGHISGATENLLEIDSLRGGDGGGFYYMEAYNGCGMARSKQVTFNLLAPARFVKGLEGTRLLMCDGDKQVLMVEATGSPAIRYIWTQSGRIIADGYSNRLEVEATQVSKTETFVCHIQNMCSKGGELTEAYITTSRPDPFELSGGGGYCERDAVGVSACLQGSDTSVIYRLYRKPEVLAATRHGREAVPPTGPLCFTGIDVAGTYYVVAEDTNGCTATMPGLAEVVEHPLPADFQLSIRKHLCENTDFAEVELSGSELGVKYVMCKFNGIGWDTLHTAPWPMAGTGGPLSFELTEGEYKMIAVNESTGCERGLSPALSIIERPLPPVCDLAFYRNDSTYCRNAVSDVRIDQACYEAGSNYVLQKDGADYGNRVAASPVYWTGLEKGVYRVKATNSWGCIQYYGNKEVKTQEPPQRYTLIGRRAYCRYDTDSSWIELSGSDPGVNYSFRYKPGTVYKDTMGNGSNLFLYVPLQERDYYVIARDTTPEHCEMAMYDTVELRMSRLDVTAVSPVLVNYGDPAQLNLTVSGAVGNVSYAWTPSVLLPSGQGTVEDPTTVAMKRSAVFHVKVTDDGGCPKEVDVVVTVLGGDLAGEITDTEGNAVDTLQLCEGEELRLHALISGGACNGAYTYAWSDRNGVLTGGAVLDPVKLTADTKIFMQAGCGNETVKDTVVVIVNPSAPADTIERPGLRCIVPGDPLAIRLKSSDPSAYYYLEGSADGTAWTEIQNMTGNGGALSFVLSDAAAYYGYKFRIMARVPHKTADGGSCEKQMVGEVEVEHAPRVFRLSEGWAYCADQPEKGVIAVDSSEQGVSYQLRKVGAAAVATLAGTGDTLKFANIVAPGSYIVEATLGSCVTVMPDTVKVTEYPVPGIGNLTGSGSYCATECPLTIGITAGEKDTKYTLSSTNPAFASREWTGIGAHTFVDDLCDTGRYTLTAENVVTHCRKEYGPVVLAEAPGEVAITGGGEYCADSSGISGAVCITSPESGIFYGLYAVNNLSVPVDTLRLQPDGSVCGGRGLTAGNYVVIGKVGSCQRQMEDTVHVIRHELPGIGTLTGGGNHCSSECPLTIGITAAEPDVRYTLVSDSPGFTEVIRMGTGALTFGTDFCDTGVYRVKAKHTVTGCEAVYDSVMLAPSPGEVRVSGGGEFCPDSSYLTTEVCIASPESGVSYGLYAVGNKTTALGSFKPGAGGSLCNRLSLAAGDYVVIGKVGNCSREMTDTVKVQKKKIYDESGREVRLVLEGNGCVDSTVILSIAVAPAPYAYQLYHDGVAVGTAKTGTGGRLQWNISPAQTGVWSVKSVIDGCEIELNTSVEIKPAPRRPVLSGDTLYCEGKHVGLWVAGAEFDVNYELYRWPEDTLVKSGQLNGSKAEFKQVTAGTYYVKASRGSCLLESGRLKVSEVAAPALPEIASNDCVEAGKGELSLKGLSAAYRYTVSGPLTATIEKYAGDSVLRHLQAGIYTVETEDTLSGCKSELHRDTIREGAAGDSLLLPLAYCEGEAGVQPALSNVHLGMAYSILTPGGSVLETIRYPQKQFSRKYPEGNYIFRRERESFPAGCRIETLIEVRKQPLPSSRIAVSLLGGMPVCEGAAYQVQLITTQGGVDYVLQQSDPEAALDTLEGTGGSRIFTQVISRAGSYRIAASDTLMGCRVWLDTVITVHPAPEIVTGDCAYCDTEAEGCHIAVNGMETGVFYRIEALDTLTGPGNGKFDLQPAGLYRVIAENVNTGCKDTAKVNITAKPGPAKYAVVAGCYATDEVFDLRTTNSETGVNYYLYKDDVRVSSVPVAGNDGTPLSFGDQNMAGVYRVKAQSENGCEVELSDSVVVYRPLQAFDAEVVGSFCNGDLSAGVELRLYNTVPGWKYYVSNGFLSSDTLAGRSGTLAWNKLQPGNTPVLNGIYSFHALSPCGTDVTMGSLTVNSELPPVKFAVVDKPLYYCAPEAFTLALAGSETGVKYIVKRYNSSGTLLQTYPAVMGDATTVPFVLGSFTTPGYYEIIADNGCPLQIDMWEVKGGRLPDLHPLAGSDVCRLSASDSIEISLSVRQGGVDYYLYRDETPVSPKVDSMTATWRPAPELSFAKQGVVGCYYVVGENTLTGCKREMEGRLCLNVPPVVYQVEPHQAPGDTLIICRETDTCIWLSGSEAGTGYELLLNGLRVNTVTGTGGRLNMGQITESGIYRVNAYVCGVMMDDSVIVKVLELPSLALEPEMSYCQGSEDSLRVLSFTSGELTYSCYRPDGTLLASRTGNSDGSGFRFPAPLDGEGYYRVEVRDAAGCTRTDSTKVVMEPQPDGFNITSSNGEYICRGSFVKLGLDGSEEGVRYQLRLYSPAEDISEREGTGGAFEFTKQIRKPGTYYVTATYRHGLGCSVDFGSYSLQLADTLLPFEVESVVNSYCITSAVPGGSIRLSGSQAGKKYQLTRDGVLLDGTVKWGNGGVLTWTGLEGKTCDDAAIPDGYVYRVVATDTTSGCQRTMFGSDTIVAASPVRILAQEPSNPDFEKCEGTEVKFSVTTSGCRMTYKWIRNGLTLKEGPEPFYNIAEVKPADYGTYECEISNSCGTRTSKPINLSVRELVKMETAMPDEYVCDATKKQVMFSAGFRNAETYVWYKVPDGTTEIGHRNFYEITEVQPSDSGRYVVVANNRCQVEVRDTAELFIGATPVLDIFRPVTDTLCFGSSYATPVVTADVPFHWYLNGVKLNYTGNRYTVAAVTHADEGNYSVEAENACGTSTLAVGSLWVDDTLKVVSVSGPELIRCPSDGAIELSVDVQPASDRIQYLWQDNNGNEIGRESRLLVGPFEMNSWHSYLVWFMNKCSGPSGNSQEINVRVPDSIEVADPLRNVTLCADCMTDTVLRLGLNKTMMVEFEWYYRKTKEGDQGVILSRGDTIAIRACTENSGYYYCHYFNRCETKTTETSWVRIDTVPVIKSPLMNDTLCEGMSLKQELTATGGDLTYEWHLQFRDGRDSVFDVNKQAAQSGTDAGIWPVVDMSLDSALIWCYVHNNCGEAYSDTIQLRVLPKMELNLSPSDTTICKGDTVMLNLSLMTGLPLWEYGIRLPDGTEKKVADISSREHTLKIAEEGVYQVTYMKDANDCMLTENLPKAELKYYPVTDLVMSGSQSVCLDDTVSIRFEVTGGAGPWKVKVVDLRTGGIASELCGTDGLIFHGRDTVIRFAGVDTAEYSVNEVTDLGTGCGVQSLQDSVVKVIVNRSDHIEFTSGPWHVGQCRDANLLRDVLQPRLMSGNTLPGNVHFYVNGVDRGVSGILLQGELRGDSCYRVVCRYTDTEGCGVSSDEVLVCVDSLPSGAVVSSDVACESVVNYFELELRPAGRIDSVVIRQARYKKWDSIVNPVVRPSYRTISYGKTQIPSGGLLQVPLNWDEIGGIDSCMTFEVLDIFDSHGCRMNHGISVREYDSLYRDTVWRHWDPVVDVEVRRSESKPWDRGVHEVNLPQGDSVQVRVTLVKGMPLWSLPTLGVDSIATMDTVFWLKQEGIYYFQPKDLSCGRQSTTPPYDLTITHLDTGYFRGRLLLEGVYDESLGDMSWGGCNTGRLSDSLNLPAHLPLLPSHLDVIDWVEVELRVGSNIDSVALMTDSSFLLTRDTCLLLSDGHLADRLTGDTIVGIRNAYGSGSNRRYVAVRHRNHLGVMTSQVYPFVKKTNKRAAVFIDFTKSSTIYLRGGVSGNSLNHHMTYKSGGGSGVWLLSAGELNTNSLVTLHDPNRVTWNDMHPTTSSGRVVGYRYDLLHDINLDGCVDWPGWNGTAKTDWLFVERNRQKFTEVRWR